MSGSIPANVLEMKVYDKFVEAKGSVEAKKVVSAPDDDLRAMVADYHVEYRRRMNELKEEVTEYQNALETLKDLKGGMRDTLKPKKAFLDLGLYLIESRRAGMDAQEINSSKLVKKAKKLSSKDYVDEFLQRTDGQIYDFITSYYLEERKLKSEMLNSQEYMQADSLKKSMEAKIKDDLAISKKYADLAAAVLRERGITAPQDDIEVATND